MKWLIFIISISLIACTNNQSEKSTPPIQKQTTTLEKEQTAETEPTPYVDNFSDTIFDEAVLIPFLDSIGQLNTDAWQDSIIHFPDSLLHNQLPMYFRLSDAQFSTLKAAIKTRKISKSVANEVFPFIEREDYNTKHDEIYFEYFSFDKDERSFDKFAIVIDFQLYFFKGAVVIGKHAVGISDVAEVEHFKNEIGKTVIQYKLKLAGGSGIWWYQYFFYQYDGSKLIPVLTEMQNINLQFPWSFRSYWIETQIINTNPLQLKFIYNNQFFRTSTDFINDSTVISYTFDKENIKYQPNYSTSKQTKDKLLSYYHSPYEFLFIHAHYDLLKKALNGDDKEMRMGILRYLRDLKEYFDKNQ